MKKVLPSPASIVSRRKLLECVAAGTMTTLLCPSPSLAQDSIQSRALGQNIYLLQGAGTNVVVHVGRNSVLVVDGGLPVHGEALLNAINRLSGDKPVSTLFNTNWRPEHCGLNYLLGDSGTAIIAHENTRLWQSNDFSVPWENTHHHPVPPSARANSTLYTTDSLIHDGETVEYGFISQCHTDGDIYVHFKDANILAVGDMVATESLPQLDYVTGGWIAGAQKCAAGLLGMSNDKTVVVPAEGEPVNRVMLETYQGMLDHAYEVVANAFRTGRSLDQFLASNPMEDYVERYGDPELFLTLLYRGTWYHIPGRAVSGII